MSKAIVGVVAIGALALAGWIFLEDDTPPAPTPDPFSGDQPNVLPQPGDDGTGPTLPLFQPNPYIPQVQEASARYGVRESIINGVIERESSFNPQAQSFSSSARGLMGMTQAAAIDVGADYDRLFDPAYAIDAGTRYLARMISEFGEWDGVRAYYAGPGTVRKGINTTLLAQADSYASDVFA